MNTSTLHACSILNVHTPFVWVHTPHTPTANHLLHTCVFQMGIVRGGGGSMGVSGGQSGLLGVSGGQCRLDYSHMAPCISS